MRSNVFLTLAALALAACDSASNSLGPNPIDGGSGPGGSSQARAHAPGTADSATKADSAAAASAITTLQLAGRAAARCESTRAPRVFVRDTAAFVVTTPPAVARVLAGRPRLRLPTLLELGPACAVGG
jgi:hypothetical protein